MGRAEGRTHSTMRCAICPRDRIRFHACYSINIGLRVFDMELKDIVDIMLRVRARAYSFEYGNPRHEHEWRVWKGAKLRDDKILIPGVISNSTVVVEHPEVVADRITRFADVVGRERVIAGADCGFATNAGSKEFAPSIVWAKLKSLSDGARIATERLWIRPLPTHRTMCAGDQAVRSGNKPMSARALPAALLRRIAGPDRGRRLASRFSGELIDPEFLPPLSAVLSAWFSITLSGELPYHAAFSLLNLGVGLMFGAAARRARRTAYGLVPSRQRDGRHHHPDDVPIPRRRSSPS